MNRYQRKLILEALFRLRDPGNPESIETARGYAQGARHFALQSGLLTHEESTRLFELERNAAGHCSAKTPWPKAFNECLPF